MSSLQIVRTRPTHRRLCVLESQLDEKTQPNAITFPKYGRYCDAAASVASMSSMQSSVETSHIMTRFPATK